MRGGSSGAAKFGCGGKWAWAAPELAVAAEAVPRSSVDAATGARDHDSLERSGRGGLGTGPAMSEVTRSLLQRWGASFRRGADFDSWGQLVEAIDEYQILARHLQKEAQAQHNNSEFTEEQKKTIGKIATCLELRSAALQSTQSQDEFKLEDLKKLEPILKNILTYNKEFPFDVQPVPLRRILAPGEEENLEFEDDEEEGGAGAGSPDSFPARVPDLNGIDLTPVQDTPVASRKEDTYVHFNVDIELQKHIEKLTKGAAIFFEFKHYKPKKRFTSTKCFAFMEMDEIKPGPIIIELYKKPTDFKRKKLQLLTKKPLYLHLHQTLHKE
ncbi:axin interactor, dorsalization-associated protein isoform X2 [Antechinus flavipes]|uniref:axin interactor, dorsalization-associated protein isoform X2 n=2 Tax=Dasyuridae TaxID=9277 RepID=UPI00223586F2|nr:axin interactor, dorsalization-associated protein isoform X2 [Antechinus flavipes]